MADRLDPRDTTHWVCACGEVMNSRKARDHYCYPKARRKIDEPDDETVFNDLPEDERCEEDLWNSDCFCDGCVTRRRRTLREAANEVERLNEELELRRAFERDQEAEVERLRAENTDLIEANQRLRRQHDNRTTERDHYREALERIADHKHAGPELLRATAGEREADAYWDVKAVARAVLDDEDPQGYPERYDSPPLEPEDRSDAG